MENGYDNARLIRKKKPETDAFLCATDTIAIGAMKYLHEFGVKIPEEIAVCGFGNGKTAAVVTPIPDNDPLLLPDKRYRGCKNAA